MPDRSLPDRVVYTFPSTAIVFLEAEYRWDQRAIDGGLGSCFLGWITDEFGGDYYPWYVYASDFGPVLDFWHPPQGTDYAAPDEPEAWHTVRVRYDAAAPAFSVDGVAAVYAGAVYAPDAVTAVIGTVGSHAGGTVWVRNLKIGTTLGGAELVADSAVQAFGDAAAVAPPLAIADSALADLAINDR